MPLNPSYVKAIRNMFAFTPVYVSMQNNAEEIMPKGCVLGMPREILKFGMWTIEGEKKH